VFSQSIEFVLISYRLVTFADRPGNIHFRQVINKFREIYNSARRSKKIDVAEDVVKAIHDVGGRFLRESEGGNGDWIEISHDRAVEKVCQALREKDKANPPTRDPFTDPDKITELAPSTTKKQKRDTTAGKTKKKKEKRSSTDLYEDEEEGEEISGDASSDSDDHDDAGESSSSEKSTEQERDDDDDGDDPDGGGGADVFDLSSPIARLKLLPSDKMIRKLETFKASYGHCGVPPGWPHDVVFANWCTVQRQIRRETGGAGSGSNGIALGAASAGGGGVKAYREASELEQILLQRLDEMGFVWDYEDWHWNDRCDKFESFLNGTDDEDPTYTAQNVVGWIHDQRSQLRTGSGALPSERAERLRGLGVAL